jgi:NAD(P)-dependent dehydrogenase (short-subunit alcohol dehydrogenase family)
MRRICIMSKTWFITGISRGFGLALTEALLAKGETVIGTTRDGSAPIDDASGKLHVVALDVTDPAAIKDAVGQAIRIAGRLDVVVNNAGYGLLGSVESGRDAEIEQLFAVNFHGPRRIIQAVLPQLRLQGSGHIVNITSIAGLAANPGSGLYAASKFAVEGMSQALAQEVAPFGIKVTLVEPGAFRTDFLSDHSLRKTEAGDDPYGATAGATIARLDSMAGKQLGDPAKAATAIITAVEAPQPPLNLVLGSDAFRRVQDRQKAFAADLERWQTLTLGTDFA